MNAKMHTLLLFGFLSSTIAAQETYFLMDPTVSPDAQTVVFSYDTDLWSVPAKAGTALRLTAMNEEEMLPNISPDGKWLAFSATQFGNKDIFLMPMEGGSIQQLTFNDANSHKYYDSELKQRKN
ncbi:MAG: tricorn protease [Maribacter sp.]|jgi:tricorn protease|tara:strand:+ start:1850 stop:2221 length:372 start_codon:yes stop_codon:yes gene_type:complete